MAYEITAMRDARSGYRATKLGWYDLVEKSKPQGRNRRNDQWVLRNDMITISYHRWFVYRTIRGRMRRIPGYIAELERALSSDRLTAYRPDGGDDRAMVVTYFWNVALRQALYGALGDVEVAFRNGIHRTLSEYFSHEDWYERNGLLQHRESKILSETKKAVSDSGKEVIPGRVVAALSFGFWTSLLGAIYGESPNGPRLWTEASGLLAEVFPYAPEHYRNYRSRLHTRIDSIRRLRNRVFHHEPVWNGISIPSRRKAHPPLLVPLGDLHSQVLETTGWMSPALLATTARLEIFPAVLAEGYASIEHQLQQLPEVSSWLEGR